MKRACSRRRFLQATGSTVGALSLAWNGRIADAWAAPAVLPKATFSGPKLRPDLLDKHSPEGAEVLQLTTEHEVPSSHVYMEAPIFTGDSKRFVLHRCAYAHSGRWSDSRHQYLLCDIEDGCSLHVLTHEKGARGPAVSPDGKYLYYFVEETKPAGGRISLKRVNLDGTHRETLVVVDGPLPGTLFCPRHLYPLSTISSDGKRLAISAFLGDGKTENPPFGLMVFDVERASVALVLHGPSWCNMHPQYCRSADPQACHDILVQENHGNETDARGRISRLTGGTGADIHVIRDDGTRMRDMPWGRDGNEYCQGHQCWRGRSLWAITSTSTRNPREAQLIESLPVAHAGHLGAETPGGLRNDLSRDFPDPQFHHFATDIEGKHLVSDAKPFNEGGRIFLAELSEPGKDALRNFRYLLNPRSSCTKNAHIHPFLSPDGSMAFFNSDESGLLQAYMIRGYLAGKK